MGRKKIPKPILNKGVDKCIVNELIRCYRAGYNKGWEENMDAPEKEQQLYFIIKQALEHYTMENTLTYIQIIGTLETLKDDYMYEMKNETIQDN